MDNLQNIVEAILFAAGIPVRRSEILTKLPSDVSRKDLDGIIEKIGKKYSGDSGIVLQVFNDKIQLASNSNYGDVVADVLQPVKEKELSDSLLQVLSIIAYFQPITKARIEKYRGDHSADYAIMMLSRAELIDSDGVDTSSLGRPKFYVTTENFLKKFELESLDDLPSLDEVRKEMYELGPYTKPQDGLYREVEEVSATEDEPTDATVQQEAELAGLEDVFDVDMEIPEYLKDDEYEVVGEDLSQEELKKLADVKIDSDSLGQKEDEDDGSDLGV